MLTQLSICIILVKLMSLAEQSFADFQAVLDRHRANETAYKDRLKEINLTRSKIADQLEALQQTYDKKLRGLQQKLQALRGQNDTLLRENTLYRSEIQTYQSRLLEKEKIIAALLSQRRDLPVVGSSEKSKSDKTDSLNANEEENKAFKKQAVFKEDYDHPVSSHQKFKQESPVQRHVEPIVPPKHEKPVERPAPPKKKVAPLVLPQEITNEKPSLPHVEEPPKAIEKTETVEVKHTLPPPPPPRAGKPKEKVKPMKNPFNYTAPNEENLDANNFFSNLGKVQTQEVKPVEEVHVVKETYEQQPDFRQENHHFQQEEISAPAEAEYEETPHIQQEQPEEAAHQQQQNQFQQQFQQPQFEQQTKNEYKHYKEQEFQPQPQEDQTYTPEPSQQSSDFLSHFNTQPQTDNYYQPLPIKPKPKKKNTRTVARQEVPAEPVEPQANGNDFFAQLSKGEHEHHQLDNIEQSSIDHIDRDNSLLSNEQPYFTQEPAPKRPVKMSKKKKRDQIKMMDPSCFE